MTDADDAVAAIPPLSPSSPVDDCRLNAELLLILFTLK
jgi:hypothetical protein